MYRLYSLCSSPFRSFRQTRQTRQEPSVPENHGVFRIGNVCFSYSPTHGQCDQPRQIKNTHPSWFPFCLEREKSSPLDLAEYRAVGRCNQCDYD